MVAMSVAGVPMMGKMKVDWLSLRTLDLGCELCVGLPTNFGCDSYT
jgi:hypothetical protein